MIYFTTAKGSLVQVNEYSLRLSELPNMAFYVKQEYTSVEDQEVGKMKPTKARLRNYVDTLKIQWKRNKRKKTKAIRAHIESEWLKIDPEFKKLRGYFESLKIRQNVK